MKLDTSNPRLRKLFDRVLSLGVTLPLVFFLLLALSLGEDTERCGKGRRNIIEHGGVEHCVNDIWAFVDALALPWIALGLVLILICNLAPRFDKWLTDKGR